MISMSEQQPTPFADPSTATDSGRSRLLAIYIRFGFIFPILMLIGGSQTLIWWTLMTFDGERACSITLTPENAISWQGIFNLPE